MKRRNWILALTVAASIAALSTWAFTPRPIQVEMRPIELAPFEQTVDEEGRTRVRARYTLSAPAAGRLERIALKAGDAVQAGDTVAVIRPAPPALQDTRALAQLRERVGASEAGKLRAEANVARAQAALELASFEAERARKLAAQGFAAKSVDDQARLALAQQRQGLEAAQYERHAAEHELAVARAALAQSDPATRRAGDAGRIEVRAPAGGRVLKIVQESEAVVATGTAIAEIGDPTSLEAVIEVLSQDAARIAPGMPVSLTASSAAPRIDGRVRLVEPSARTKVSTLGVEEQRVNVLVDFDAAPPSVGDGYRVDARIVVLARDRVPVAPVGALFRHGEGWAVFVFDDGRARRRDIEIGARNPRLAWITTGLSQGDTVIVYPPDTVRDGVRVKPRQ